MQRELTQENSNNSAVMLKNITAGMNQQSLLVCSFRRHRSLNHKQQPSSFLNPSINLPGAPTVLLPQPLTHRFAADVDVGLNDDDKSEGGSGVIGYARPAQQQIIADFRRGRGDDGEGTRK